MYGKVKELVGMSEECVKGLQRLSKGFESLQCDPVSIRGFGSVPKNLDDVVSCPYAYDGVLMGVGARVSLHHGVSMTIRYSVAMRCRWH